MSVKTYTPVSYWLAQPIVELSDWVRVYVDMSKKGGGGRG